MVDILLLSFGLTAKISEYIHTEDNDDHEYEFCKFCVNNFNSQISSKSSTLHVYTTISLGLNSNHHEALNQLNKSLLF
jgi:hypothetical protein